MYTVPQARHKLRACKEFLTSVFGRKNGGRGTVAMTIVKNISLSNVMRIVDKGSLRKHNVVEILSREMRVGSGSMSMSKPSWIQTDSAISGTCHLSLLKKGTQGDIDIDNELQELVEHSPLA